MLVAYFRYLDVASTRTKEVILHTCNRDPRIGDRFSRFRKRMKQKVVLKLQMNDAKSRCKAMKVVVSLPGVISAALEGEDKSKIVVVGEGLDSIALTRFLRKNMGYAELVSVIPYDEKKEKKQEEYKHDKEVGIQPRLSIPHYVYEVHETPHDPCSIM